MLMAFIRDKFEAVERRMDEYARRQELLEVSVSDRIDKLVLNINASLVANSKEISALRATILAGLGALALALLVNSLFRK